MALDDDVNELIERKKARILILDDACSYHANQGTHNPPKEYEEHIEAEMECRDFLEKDDMVLLALENSHSEFANNRQTKANFDILLARPNMLAGAPNFMQTFNTIAEFRAKHPKTKTYLYVPKMTGSAQAALNKVVPIFQAQGLFDESIEIDYQSYPTTWHHLLAVLTGKLSRQEQHRYKNEMWENKYLPLIDKSLRAGNSQTKADFHFLILSDKECNLLGDNEPNAHEKVKVRKLDYQLEQEDLEKCAAIFVDNNWNKKQQGALGKGREKLRQIRKDLDEKGTNIPIIYQSGHNLEDFTEQEKQEIESLGAVLATKDIFPKVCKGREKAEKEKEISRILQANPALSKYAAKVYDFNLAGPKDLFVVCTKIADSKEDTKDRYEHRMQVLAQFHEIMKDQLGNEKINKPTVDYFRDFHYLKQGLKEFEIVKNPETRTLYETIKAEHEKELQNPTTIIHNDAKWDNWFGLTLGDFADACAGKEYRDLAKALLDKETGFENVKKPEWVENHVKQYMTARGMQDEGFARKVKEMIFIEALRLARNKINEEDTAKGLISVAEAYKEILK